MRLVVLMMPANSPPELLSSVRTAAGIAYMVSLVTLFIFVSMVRLFGWPTRKGAFNVWINLPCLTRRRVVMCWPGSNAMPVLTLY